MILDKHDLKLLALLQHDATRTVAELARDIGLSQNACWRRIKQLEDSGTIRRQVVLLDPVAVGCPITVFVGIRTTDHSDAWFDRLSALVVQMQEVVEFYRMSGDVDYLLKLRVVSLDAYDRLCRTLGEHITPASISASFALREIKQTTEIPLPATAG